MGRQFVVQQADDGGSDHGPIPDDTLLNATLMGTKIELKEFANEPNPVERMSWKFRVDDDPYLDKYVYGTTGTKLVNHANCKIYLWAQAVLDINPLPLDYGFQEEDLWNRPCRILVGAQPGKNKAGEDTIFNRVEDVMPAGKVVTAGASSLDDDF